MENSEEPQPNLWFKIPENLAFMTDEELRVFAESLWLEINIKLGEDYEQR